MRFTSPIEELQSTMELKLRSVRAADIPSLHEILVVCGLDLQERFGLDYWLPPYPLEKMRQDLEDKRIYCISVGREVVATFTLETKMPSEYTRYGKIHWQVVDVSAMYVHRLAVLPTWQGQGLGTWCLQAIENLAINSDCGAVRLDAVKMNSKLSVFYQRQDYRLVGELIYDPETLFNDAFVFEKVLPKSIFNNWRL
ncbi:MAG: hypothetical protein CLLPBCKN_006095 [Chroococcidiopsis cubana SAG 39.79]|nr:hypothetical protein [Chroococcidiopsis cubana SAG 39.79]